MAIKVEVETAPESGVWNDYTSLVMVDSLVVVSQGGADAGTSTALFRDISGTAVVLPECGYRVTDGTTVIFRGKIKKRGKTERYTVPRGKWYSITAQDATSLLVDDVVDTGGVRTGSRTDKAEVEWLLTTYGTKGVTTGAAIQSTGTIDREIDYTGMNLFEALTEAAKWLGVRFYVAVDLALHWYVTETNSAPFNLSDNPNGSTTFGYDGFDFPDDSLDLVNAVYVIGTGGAGEWVPPTASWPTASHTTYGRKESAFVDETLDDTTKRQAAGMAIIDKYGVPRGPIKLTTFQPGLRADMVIQITNSTWGLTAVSYTIAEVTASVNGSTGTFKYDVSLQDAPIALQNVIGGGFDRVARDVDRSTNNALTYAEQFLIGRVKVVAVLPTLPDANYPIGSQVFLTADNKLYRNPDDAAWTASVFLPDGIGKITGTQIADDAISTPHIAANSIAAGAIQAGAITANEIAANTIVAGNIAAGAIGAEALASQIVLADILFTTDLPPNQRVEIDDAGVRAYDASNKRVVNIPSVGSDPVEVIGKIETGDFTSNASAELRGTNTLAAASVTTAEAGITNPPAGPSVIVDVPSGQLSAPAQPGYGLCLTQDGAGASTTYWVGANPTIGNLLDLAYEYGSNGALLRTLRKTGTTTQTTTTVGSTSHVSDSAQARQETGVQVATPLTIPSNLVSPKITKVRFYAAGYNGGTPTVYGCVYDTSNNDLGNTSGKTLTARAFANGNSDLHDLTMTAPLAVTAGTTYRVGWYQTSNEGIQWDRDDGSSKTQYRGTNGAGNLSITETLTANKPNVSITVEHTVDTSNEGNVGQIVGVARTASYIFVLDNTGLLIQYNRADLTYVGQTSHAANIPGPKGNAGLVFDGTNLNILCSTGITGTDQVRFISINATTRAFQSNVATTGFAVNGNTATFRGGYWDGTSWHVNVNGVVRVYTSGMAYVGGGYDFGSSVESSGGYHGGSWIGHVSVAYSTHKVTFWTSFDAASTTDRTFSICYTWYKSTATTRETARSPLWTGTIGRRRRYTVINPAIPVVSGETPDRVRIYAYAGTPSAGASWLQVTDALTSRTLTSYTGSGTHDPTSNSFPVGTPAQIKSALQPGFLLRGDGWVDVIGLMEDGSRASGASGSTGGYWWKVGGGTFTGQYQQFQGRGLALMGGNDNSAVGGMAHALVDISVYQQNALGNQPYAHVAASCDGQFKASDFKVIVTSATGSSTVWEFWMRVPAPWFAVSFRWLQTYGIAFIQNDGAALVSAASAGTAYLSRWMGTPWQSVTYLNSWTTYTGWSQPAKYRRDANGNVFVTGMIQGGTPGATSVVFTLPSGFRPADQLLFGTHASGGTSARIDVQTDGDVIVSTGSTTWTTLSGVQFLADGS